MSDPRPGDVRAYIQHKGWEILRTEKHKGGPQLVIAPCPLCGKESKNRTDRHFYIAEETGQFLTYCCDQRGNLITLRQRFGDLGGLSSLPNAVGRAAGEAFAQKLGELRGTTHKDLPPQASLERYEARLRSGDAPHPVLVYLRSRGFDDATIKAMRFGAARRGWCGACKAQTSLSDGDLCPKCKGIVSNGDEYLAIPYLVGARVHNFKFRNLSDGKEDRRFERWTGAPTTPWNVDSLGGEYKRAIMTEAELDGATLVQCGYGPVISLAGSKMNPDEALRGELARFDEIILAYDADEQGTAATARLAEMLGRYRCRTVVWPQGMKDANDCLKAGMAPLAIRAVIEASIAVATSPVRSVDAFAAQLKLLRGQGKKMWGNPTRWNPVNEMLGGGWRDGELTVVTGETGHGKSTWCVCAAWDQARGDIPIKRAPVPSLLCSFELMAVALARKVVQMEVGKAFADVTDLEIETSLNGLPDLYVLDKYGTMALGELCDVIEYAVRRHGVRFVVVDHLHFFLDVEDDERRAIDVAVRRLATLTKQLMIHMLLVVHPAKLRLIGGAPQKAEMNDLKGASSIKQDADNVIRVYRMEAHEIPAGVGACSDVATLKVRDDAGMVHHTALAYDRGSLRFEYDPRATSQITHGGHKKNGRKRGGGRSAAAASAPDDNDERSEA